MPRRYLLTVATGRLVAGYGWAGDRNDAHEAIDAGEVGGVGRVQRQALGDSCRGDHQARDAATWLAPGGDDGGGHTPVDACGLGVERDGIEFTRYAAGSPGGGCARRGAT